MAESISGALGHGAVATYPDRPYLNWSFVYEFPKKSRIQRNNPENFLKGCQALHDMFTRFAGKKKKNADGGGVPFSKIKNSVAGILGYQAKMEDRIKQRG